MTFIRVRILHDIRDGNRPDGSYRYRAGQVVSMDAREAGPLLMCSSDPLAELVDEADERHLSPGFREYREFRRAGAGSGPVELATGHPATMPPTPTPAPAPRGKLQILADMARQLRAAGRG